LFGVLRAGRGDGTYERKVALSTAPRFPVADDLGLRHHSEILVLDGRSFRTSRKAA